MPHRITLLLLFALLPVTAFGLTVEEIAQRFKALPTVPEAELPPMKNEREPFPGLIKHEGLEGHTWVRFPFVENPGSFGFDPKGRLYVAEANRFWLGVPDLRGVNPLIRGDFQAVTVADRQKLYDAHAALFPAGFFDTVADRIIRLEDRDGNGAADHRTLFSDHFKAPLDGIGFSVLAEDDAVYFTCIPSLWKLRDTDDDGVADEHESLVEGFGVRVSFIGHDLHGIIRGPDGRLYFSVGDRGYHVTTPDGQVHAESGRGAIFRCNDDGSDFEVFCRGLRNPQELAFDEYGNLFTFDNTGDIGDLARMVYALENSDSGWDMSHQSAHHYVKVLDWGEFHPPTSMWVEEKMFDTWNPAQPQWVYPPASHVARGPSGVTWMTGESLPEDLRGKFLLSNYRGPSVNCTILTVGIEPHGAGYRAVSEDVLVEGVGVSDVELGYDGKLYLCDFGGGWSVNTQGAIQVLASKNEAERSAGEALASRFKAGPGKTDVPGLRALLQSPDRRMRQQAQFALVGRGKPGHAVLAEVAADASLDPRYRLHGLWGLGQLGDQERLLGLLADPEAELRANAARTLGREGMTGAREALLKRLEDESPRVRSLAAVALGRIGERGDRELIQALYALVRRTGNAKEFDPVLRHAVLGALDRVGTVGSAVGRVASGSDEVRMTALLYLRRHQDDELVRFLFDESEPIRHEAIRAIYDTGALDSLAGRVLAMLDPDGFPVTLQRRVVAANYRLGEIDHARRLVQLAARTDLDRGVRESALHALGLWEACIDTDPVLGHFRPQVQRERSMQELGVGIETPLKALLASELPPSLAALGLKLADASGVTLEQTTLRSLAGNPELESALRVAALDSLVKAAGKQARPLVGSLLEDPAPELAAAALRHGFTIGLDGIEKRARNAVASAALPMARAGLSGLAGAQPDTIAAYWKAKEELRPELWLDTYLALKETAPEHAAAYTASDAMAVHQLSQFGGDAARGEAVFRNQGACLQCHKIGSDGGIQGPPLNNVGERLKPDKLVESLVNPNAEIAPGYGLSSITLKDGAVIAGRIAKQTKKTLTVVALDGTSSEYPAEAVASVTPPVSAMPPLGASLPPRDLRDLVAFLASRAKAPAGKDGDAESHGDKEEEKVAK